MKDRGLILGAAALGLAFVAFRKSKGSAPAIGSEAFVTTGASGEEGGARWEVYRADSGSWAYRITARLAGDADFSVIDPVEEFAAMREAIEAARSQTSELCDLPDYDCSGEPPPKTQSATIGP
jgi:hypothetical protein